jgi:hypothetical protein
VCRRSTVGMSKGVKKSMTAVVELYWAVLMQQRAREMALELVNGSGSGHERGRGCVRGSLLMERSNGTHPWRGSGREGKTSQQEQSGYPLNC